MKEIYFLLFLLIISANGSSQSYEGTIIRVIDGDTYVFQTTEGSFIVRMLGIDAPENKQPFSRESAGFLSKYLNMEAVTKVSGTDRYSRRLGILYIDEQDINLLSVKGGYSWHFKKYSSDKEYAAAEETARKNKLGLWHSDNPLPPWSWRKK